MTYERKARIAGIVAAALAAGLTLALMLMLYLRYTGDEPRKWPPEDTSELLLAGEYVQLGDVPTPERDTAPAQESKMEETPENQDVEDAGAAVEEPTPPLTSTQPSPMKVKEKPKPEKTGPTKEEIAAQQKAKREKEAAERVAGRVKFGGTSPVPSAGTGHSGSPNGNAAAGALTGQPGFNLRGRTIARWSRPKGTATGTITVRVRVNRTGNVVGAEYNSGTGPVASDPAARRSCEQAALASKFSSDDSAPAEQTGNITYIFE